MRDFLAESIKTNADELETTKRDHADAMARRYLKHCREASTTNGSRYLPEEFMKLQGVRADLIAPALAKVRKRYEA